MNGTILNNFIDGSFVKSRGTQTLDISNPATRELLAKVQLSTREDVDEAVRVAKKAFMSWRQVPLTERARYLFKFKMLLEKHQEELARSITQEHGKTFDESMKSMRRGIENVECACGVATLMMGESLESVSPNVDSYSMRQPLGVCAAITAYNFPGMIPLWFWPYAVAMGNTYIIKPSEQSPITQHLMFQLVQETGFPDGVVNLINGAQEVVEGLVDHPDIAALSFVGSSEIAKSVYEEAAKHGKRVQAFGGAKNHIVVMLDADEEIATNAVIESAFSCAGQRSIAGSVAILVGEVYERLSKKIAERAKALRMGNGLDKDTDMGPLTSAAHLDRVLTYIEKGIHEGAKLLLDGRDFPVAAHLNGHFIGPTVFGSTTPSMTIVREEIFGPVLCLMSSGTLEDAIAAIQESPYANTASIFTKSGAAARKFEHEAGVGMIGINVSAAAPIAFFPFGGRKASFFGDTKAQGKDAVHFFTDTKVVVSRW